MKEKSARGFTLIEIMVALVLGLLLSAGVLSLFNSTSQSNKAQAALARLQENGRFAVTRMESDLRMMGGQFCSNFSGMATGGVVPVGRLRPPSVFTPDLGWPGIHSIDTSGNPSADDATTAYLLSPRWFVQGYSAANAPADLPATGTDPGQRLAGSDVLTVRYQRGSGWPVKFASDTCTSGGDLTLLNQSGDDDFNFGPLPSGRLQNILVTDCINASVFPIASAAGATLTLGTLLPTTETVQATCANAGARDMRAFNFNSDFVTVDYYLAFREDQNPDGRPNSPTAARRVIPVLIRRENGVSEQELVQGIDELAFRFGVQDRDGRTRFMAAAEVDAGDTLCPPAPAGLSPETGCLWRAVRTVEAHLLVNSVDDVFSIGESANQYSFLGAPHTVTSSTTLPSGVAAGTMLRREFISYASNRNYNF
jgi:type IV pilus assembly protein PilW